MALYVFSCPHSTEHTSVEVWWSAIREKCPPPACAACGSAMERDWHRESRNHRPASGFPYITKNLDPTGKAIEVTSINHERELCRQFGKVKRDDSAFIDEQYLGFSWGTRNKETGKLEGQGQRYSSGGRGNPGSW